MDDSTEYWTRRGYAMHWRGDADVVFDGPIPLTPEETPHMTQHYLPDIFGPMIDKAIEAHAQGEKVFWDVSMAPSPQGLIHLVVIWGPAATIGGYNSTMLNIANIVNADEKTIDGGVKNALEELRKMRSQELSGANGQPPPTPGGDPSGIILGRG